VREENRSRQSPKVHQRHGHRFIFNRRDISPRGEIDPIMTPLRVAVNHEISANLFKTRPNATDTMRFQFDTG
jgi:hypothetical protein